MTPSQTLAVLGELAAETVHELRNVLQIISSSAFVARVELDRGDAAAARPHVAKVEAHARLAHGIVDDLLALARGEAVHKEGVRAAEVVDGARADLGSTGARWDDAIAPDLELRAHRGLLTRALHALYENAVQACAPRPARIATRAARGGSSVVIEVSDDGPGVPDALAATLFDPLVTARPGGTGLGLALARRIAIAHGGSLACVRGAGPGATFRLELPL